MSRERSLARPWLRRPVVVGACLSGLLAVGVVATLLVAGPGSSAVADDGATAAKHSTATAAEQTLTERKTFAGTLGYGAPTTLTAGVEGTVTWLPRYGDVIGRDGALASIDERPVRAMHGAVPLWRTLQRGLRGTDVRQLNENLAALGYSVTQDDRFGAATTTAVRAWQRDRGLPVTGSLDASQIAFVDGDVRVADRIGQVGGPADELYRFTSTARVVSATVPRADGARFRDGATVSIGFTGSGDRIDGRVQSVSADAGTDSDGSAGGGDGSGDGGDLEVTIELSAPVPEGVAESAGVDVVVEGEQVANALSVPVSALVATRTGERGDYVVEVVGRGGEVRRVPVRLGFAADGKVQIEGAVRAGDRVVVP